MPFPLIVHQWLEWPNVMYDPWTVRNGSRSHMSRDQRGTHHRNCTHINPHEHVLYILWWIPASTHTQWDWGCTVWLWPLYTAAKVDKPQLAIPKGKYTQSPLTYHGSWPKLLPFLLVPPSALLASYSSSLSSSSIAQLTHTVQGGSILLKTY